MTLPGAKRYTGVGTLADRPASRNVAGRTAVFYSATDAATLSVWTGAAWATVGGGGAAGALTEIAEAVVGAGGQASVQFTDIPQMYRNLLLTWTGRSSLAANNTRVYMQLHGDSAPNRDWQLSSGEYSWS